MTQVPGGDAAVALCADLREHGLDPEVMIAELAAGGVPATVSSHLCGDGSRIGAVVSDTGRKRIVLGVCPDGPSRHEVMTRGRAAGLEPFAVSALDVAAASGIGAPDGASERAVALLGARAAALAASPPVAVDGLRLRLAAEGVSRRSLLRFGGAVYEAVASIAADRCLGTAKCGVCVGSCPVDAISAERPQPVVSREACVGCGACVGACPADAVRLPGADRAGSQAEVASLAESARVMGAGVLLACAGAGLPEGAGGPWLPVMLPCLSIVTASWFAGPLAAGAPAVGIRGCGTSCDLGGSASAERAAGFVREALSAGGVRDPSSKVRVDLGAGDPTVWGEPPGEELSKDGMFPGLVEPASTVAALSRLARDAGSNGSLRVSSPGSPLGVVEIDADGCTLCGLCAGSCPTSALAMDEGPVSLALTFDAGACIACENCVKVCPESVVTVERAADLSAARSEPAVIKRGVMRRCRRCGNAVAPEAMLGRLEALLDDASPQLLDSIRDLCLDCRQLGRGASVPAPL